MPVWELLSQEMNKPGRQVRWDVPAHVNVNGNEVANGLAVEGMCSSPLGSRNVRQDLDSESKVGLRGGSVLDTAEVIWEELGLQPMDSEELTGEALGVTSTEGSRTDSGCSENCSENHEGWRGEGQCDGLSLDDGQCSTDVSDTQQRRAKCHRGTLVGWGGGSAQCSCVMPHSTASKWPFF